MGLEGLWGVDTRILGCFRGWFGGFIFRAGRRGGRGRPKRQILRNDIVGLRLDAMAKEGIPRG